MKTKRKLPVLPAAVMLFAWLLLGNQPPQTTPQKYPKPAQADSLGFRLLAASDSLKALEDFPAATVRALEAAAVFETNKDWLPWSQCYETVYRCARATDAPEDLRRAVAHFAPAELVLQQQNDLPAAAHARILGRLAFLHHNTGDYERALGYYEKAFPFAEQAADKDFLLRLYGSAANVFWHLGDDFRSIGYHQKALNLATQERDTGLMAAITTNLANAYRTSQPEKAVAAYQAALALDPQNPETHMLLSKAYIEVDKDHRRALQSAQQSLKLAAEDYSKADALHQLGRVYFSLGKYDQALVFYEKALPHARSGYGSSHPECAKIHLFRGQVFLEKKQHEAALTAFNQGMDDLLPLFSPTSPHQHPTEAQLTTTSLWILEALHGKGDVYASLFDLKKKREDLERSLACRELALRYLQQVKLRYGDDESKFALEDAWHSAGEAALGAAFRLHAATNGAQWLERAFSIAGQQKAVVLSEALYRKEVKRLAGIPDSLLQKEKDCHSAIAHCERHIMETDSLPLLRALQDSLFLAKRQREALEAQLQNDFPAYAKARFAYRNTPSPRAVRQSLPADAALVEYVLGDSAIYTFLVTADTFWAQAQPRPAAFEASLKAFRRSISDWDFVEDSTAAASAAFLQNGWQLYQWLLEKPLALAGDRRLFIVPDGPLCLLPFELLLTQPHNGSWTDRNLPFLLKNRAVSYRFAARFDPPAQEQGDLGWGGFGLEYDEATLAWLADGQPPTSAVALRNGGKLPFADDEVLAIAGLFGGITWLNERATRTNFLENAGRCGVLHLAMHGIVDERNPLRSRLVFARSALDEDPSVYASDLYNLQLRAGLAVLSACQSGTGAWRRGEGVMSLSRAFAYAGCPSLVMSLWNVSDQSTAGLMTSFYEALQAGKPKDEALRAAKLHYFETAPAAYSKPIYWAGFVAVGEMSALEGALLEGKKQNKWWFLTIGFLLSSLFVWWFKKRSTWLSQPHKQGGLPG